MRDIRVLDDGDRYVHIWERCRACGFSDEALMHAEADPDRLECAECHAMESGVTHYYDVDGRRAPRLSAVRSA